MEMLHDFDKPILFVSHNQEEVYRLADRIGSMENGRFSPIREKRGFFAEPQTVGQAKLVGCNNISEIDWISEDRVYAKDWNLSLSRKNIVRSPFIREISLFIQKMPYWKKNKSGTKFQ